jgi:FMN phosphatase YigB (HAD superfamily)
MIVYLDLDRTIYRTEKGGLIWEKIYELYPELDDKEAAESVEQYHQYVGDMYYYDFTKHLQALGLDAEIVYQQLLETELTDGRLEYPGASGLINSLGSKGVEVRVLTFGLDDYQRFKASLCPSLQAIPVITTLHEKAILLEDEAEECWLVDDKPVGLELPGNVSFAQVNLQPGAERHKEDWPICYSLKEVKEFFDEVLY